jgi:hypothetical protein
MKVAQLPGVLLPSREGAFLREHTDAEFHARFNLVTQRGEAW